MGGHAPTQEASPRYLKEVRSVFGRFQLFLSQRFPQAKEMADVTASMCREFLKAEEARGVAAKTYNNTLIFLRSCFDALKKESGSPENPFDGIPTRVEETVFRKPFTPDELKAILDACQAEPFIRPIIITGMCTAMRRGDCCLLRWQSVDLKHRFIAVKTSKTGETVDIPIFPMLEELLRGLPRDASGFVFPEQAAMYQENPDGITWRVKQVLERAGFAEASGDDGEDDNDDAPRPTLSAPREHGLRRASVRDFHSFRVTWVTLALTAGIPLELVQRVTGHRTSQIVLKHYFQPGREDFRRTLSAKLPALMGGNAKPELEAAQIRAKLEAMTSRNWKAVRDELLEGLARQSDRCDQGRYSS